MKRVIKKFIRNSRDYGVYAAIVKSVGYILSPLFALRTYRIYSLEIDRFKGLPCRDSQFRYISVSLDDKTIIRQIEEMEEWLSGQLMEKIRTGSLCIAALDKNIVAGFNLVSFNDAQIPLLCKVQHLKSDEAWSDQISVNREYRKSGLGTDIRCQVIEELKRRGIKTLSGGTLTTNISSLMLARRVGFVELVDVRFFRILNYQKYDYREVKHE
jgi:hypothetical protein